MLTRINPKFDYNGLTVILSQPSRNDINTLLEGVPGYYFNECMQPETNIHCCAIRLADDTSSFIKGTKVLLLLGAKAHAKYSGGLTTLDEGRGNTYYCKDLICISSFSPQDAIDIKDHESRLNPHLKNEVEEDFDSEEGDAGEIFESKGRGKTARDNYRFWLKADCKKALRILTNDGKLPRLYETDPNYIIAPDPDYILNILSDVSNGFLYYDKETDFISLDMRCFAFSHSSNPYNIITVPWLDINYKPYYGLSTQIQIYKALTKAIRDNILVCHNGSLFDYFVLAYKYRIPINRVYDTLIAQQRIYPKIEKSLGHCVSLTTYEPYHKNEGAHGYKNQEQADQLYRYCGKDVFTMYLVKKWQDEQAEKDVGIKSSIELANKAIKPYLTDCLMGMRFDDVKRQSWISNSDKLMLHYMKIIRTLTGPNVKDLISNQKCVEYFHNLLGYPTVSKTPKGQPSLGADNLYKLALKYNNPVIPLLIKYNETKKEIGTLNFRPWCK